MRLMQEQPLPVRCSRRWRYHHQKLRLLASSLMKSLFDEIITIINSIVISRRNRSSCSCGFSIRHVDVVIAPGAVVGAIVELRLALYGCHCRSRRRSRSGAVGYAVVSLSQQGHGAIVGTQLSRHISIIERLHCNQQFRSDHRGGLTNDIQPALDA